jgi:hypothetical protein
MQNCNNCDGGCSSGYTFEVAWSKKYLKDENTAKNFVKTLATAVTAFNKTNGITRKNTQKIYANFYNGKKVELTPALTFWSADKNYISNFKNYLKSYQVKMSKIYM